MNPLSPTAVKAVFQGFALLCLAALPAAGSDLRSVLKPDFKKTYDVQGKTFEPREFEAGKAFPIKDFPIEKIVEKKMLLKKDFKTRPADSSSKRFPEQGPAPFDKAYVSKSWTGSKEYPTRSAQQSGMTSPFAGKMAPQPDLPELGKGFKQPPVLTEEQARKLLEQLFGPSWLQ